jgi:hypothetical protein
MTNLNALKEA